MCSLFEAGGRELASEEDGREWALVYTAKVCMLAKARGALRVPSAWAGGIPSTGRSRGGHGGSRRLGESSERLAGAGRPFGTTSMSQNLYLKTLENEFSDGRDQQNTSITHCGIPLAVLRARLAKQGAANTLGIDVHGGVVSESSIAGEGIAGDGGRRKEEERACLFDDACLAAPQLGFGFKLRKEAIGGGWCTSQKGSGAEADCPECGSSFSFVSLQRIAYHCRLGSEWGRRRGFGADVEVAVSCGMSGAPPEGGGGNIGCGDSAHGYSGASVIVRNGGRKSGICPSQLRVKVLLNVLSTTYFSIRGLFTFAAVQIYGHNHTLHPNVDDDAHELLWGHGYLVSMGAVWRDNYDHILQRGYKLWTRYHPDWVPSWKLNDCFVEDSMEYLTIKSEMGLDRHAIPGRISRAAVSTFGRSHICIAPDYDIISVFPFLPGMPA
ncbi:hypothetical protein GGX14DRAFT_388263 [Mycena pura]|uniref:Uncharacterized protein n=1 Tax=Mycena pura TaxID=153505 RepID=A0AAD7E0Y7_9AGAR|nr:hypothetical protein GGX14DRAFT_388263 [Mycena pura]